MLAFRMICTSHFFYLTCRSGQRSHLFAAGGSHPEMIYCWDLQYEMCSNMVRQRPAAHLPIDVIS
jgi:hypothetical protein